MLGNPLRMDFCHICDQQIRVLRTGDLLAPLVTRLNERFSLAIEIIKRKGLSFPGGPRGPGTKAYAGPVTATSWLVSENGDVESIAPDRVVNRLARTGALSAVSPVRPRRRPASRMTRGQSALGPPLLALSIPITS